MTTEQTSQPEKKQINWEAIQAHYSAGIRSLMDIAKEYGVSDAGILKRAKKEDWTRDLSARKASRAVVITQDELATTGFVYVVFVDTGVERLFKVGMSKNFQGRIDQHQTSLPFELHVAICYFVGNMRQEERCLHSLLESKRVRGEWFNLNDQDLEAIAERALLV